MPESLAPVMAAGLRWGQPVVLLWLAVFFGRTLRSGATPLIERIARHGRPSLPVNLQRYTRRLTGLWCAYFSAAAVLATATGNAWAPTIVWTGTVVLFVGERWLRPWLFPGEAFPGLAQQMRDTWSVWRAGG